MSAPGGKTSSTGKSGGKSLVTDSKKSLISFVRKLTFPEQCVLARPCRFSQLTLTPASSFHVIPPSFRMFLLELFDFSFDKEAQSGGDVLDSGNCHLSKVCRWNIA